ncbi:hypothetical protein J4E80_010070 [Alternaria sp. BMP 0032]|nr:hypothetical protein J4E80_010070 [Alternaria sp. BMP 0032]
MAGEQPSEQPKAKPAASESDNIERFAEHVNERKRRRNLWGQYVDEQSRKKSDRAEPVPTPDPSESTNSKGTQTDDPPYVTEPDVDSATGVGDKDVGGESVKLANEGGDDDGVESRRRIESRQSRTQISLAKKRRERRREKRARQM